MRILLLLIMTLFFVPASFAQAHPEWLNQAFKVEDPNELAYWLAIPTECPITRDELENTVRNSLTKSRIKPVEKWKAEDDALYLNVSVQCASRGKDDTHAYYIRAEFARYYPPPPVLFDAPMDMVGIGGKDAIRRNCRDIVETAVTQFTKANLYVPIGLRRGFERNITDAVKIGNAASTS